MLLIEERVQSRAHPNLPLRTQCVVLPLGGNSHAYTPQFGADPEANTSTRWMPVWRALTVAGGSFTERPWSAFGATPAATKSGRGTFAIASRTVAGERRGAEVYLVNFKHTPIVQSLSQVDSTGMCGASGLS